MAEINGNFEIDGFVQQRKELEKLMTNNPAMEKKVQALIRKVLLTVRRTISGEAKTAMKTDPRQAYKAVKTAVYRQILGGSVSILNKKRAGARTAYQPPHSPSRRGGNRRTRSQRTINLQSYAGADRGFILRFLNAGTDSRAISFTVDTHRPDIKRGSRGGNVQKYGKTVNTGHRGRITPRNFFSNSSHTAMEQAAEQLTNLIDEMIKKELK